MAEPFNPYHEWLGLPADAASSNYYRLLGLPDQEPDLERIAVAGDRALARVRSFRPGVHAKAWSELLDEIYAAKSCLLEPETKAGYDRRLAGEGIARSPSQEVAAPATAGPAKAPVDIDRYPPGMAPPGARPAAAPPVKAEPAIAAELAPELPPGVYSSPTAPPYYGAGPAAHYGGYGAAALDPMAPVSIPGISGHATGLGAPQRIVGFAGAVEPQPAAAYAASAAAVPTGTAVAPQAQVPAASLPVGGTVVSGELARRREQGRQQLLLVAGVAGGAAILAAIIIVANLPSWNSGESPPTVAQVNPAPGSAAPGNSPADAPQPMPRTVESALPTGRPTPIPSVTPRPAQPPPDPMPVAPTPAPEVSPMPGPVAPSQALPMPDVTPEPMPAAVPTPPPAPMPAPAPAPAPSPEELAALAKALTLGRAALGEQNFDEADQHIAEAQSLARLPEHQAMAARLKEVAGYVRQFRQAVELASQDFEAAESFTVGTSTRVAVVEVLPDKIILRHTGQNKTYPYAELPPGLAVAIADHKLDGMDPVSRVIKGAFYAVSKGDRVALRQKAKTWWEEAQLGGVDLTHLMPFLTESYELGEPSGP